jgi:hypothetical protein
MPSARQSGPISRCQRLPSVSCALLPYGLRSSELRSSELRPCAVLPYGLRSSELRSCASLSCGLQCSELRLCAILPADDFSAASALRCSRHDD